MTRELVVLHNGQFGMVTAGVQSLATGSRERRDRIRAAWLACGWEWPTLPASLDPVPFAAPSWTLLDLAVAAALLIADRYLPDPHADARFCGVVNLDGRVLDGVVWVGGDGPWAADGSARVVRHLSDLPDALAWATQGAPFERCVGDPQVEIVPTPGGAW